jgi:hypothetical protein
MHCLYFVLVLEMIGIHYEGLLEKLHFRHSHEIRFELTERGAVLASH